MGTDEQRQWHRWFGLAWTDRLFGQPATVEVEKDLSLRQQFLDVVIVRTDPRQPITAELPDGFEELRQHNLISFKSFQEAFDLTALYELLGHFANYRKQVSPSNDEQLPFEQFALYAVSVRFPQGLSNRVELQPMRDGVYDIALPGQALPLRLIVVRQLPMQRNNAMLHLFSYREDLARFGCQSFQQMAPDTSTFLLQLVRRYQQVGWDMTLTVKQFNRENLPLILRDLPSDEAAEILQASGLLQKLPVEQRLKGVPVEQRLKGIPAEQLLQVIANPQFLQSLTPQERETLRRQLLADSPDEQSSPS